MTIENLMAGLELFKTDGLTGYCIETEHDVFYVAAREDTPSAEKLRALGWNWHQEVEAWGAFT